jgi:hypothetical protein
MGHLYKESFQRLNINNKNLQLWHQEAKAVQKALN